MSNIYRRSVTVFRVLVSSALFLFFLTTMMLFITGCSNPSPTTTALGRTVSLSPGQSVTIDGESLKIKFVEIINDSRCASGVTCIWQGEVSVRLDISYRDAAYTKVATQPGLTSNPSSFEFNGYLLHCNVQPYPTAGTTIKPGDYRLQLTVEKKSS